MPRTPNLNVVYEYVKAVYDLPIGVTSCRRIAGSQTYSQHSWSNAGDIYTTNKDLQDRIAADLWAGFGEHIRNILTWRYNAAHWNHIHVDMWPKGWLTPPCKGGALRIKYADGNITVGEPFPMSIKEEDMPLTEKEMNKIAEKVWYFLITDPVTGVKRGAAHHLASAFKFAYEGASDHDALDETTAAEIIDELVERLQD